MYLFIVLNSLEYVLHMYIIFRIKIQYFKCENKKETGMTNTFSSPFRNLTFQIDRVPNLRMWLMFEWLLTQKTYQEMAHYIVPAQLCPLNIARSI